MKKPRNSGAFFLSFNNLKCFTYVLREDGLTFPFIDTGDVSAGIF